MGEENSSLFGFVVRGPALVETNGLVGEYATSGNR